MLEGSDVGRVTDTPGLGGQGDRCAREGKGVGLMDTPAVAFSPDEPVNAEYFTGPAKVRQAKDEASVVL